MVKNNKIRSKKSGGSQATGTPVSSLPPVTSLPSAYVPSSSTQAPSLPVTNPSSAKPTPITQPTIKQQPSGIMEMLGNNMNIILTLVAIASVIGLLYWYFTREAVEVKPKEVEPEPVVEAPVAEEPVAEEPVADEPVADEPVTDTPVEDSPDDVEGFTGYPIQANQTDSLRNDLKTNDVNHLLPGL
jgi:hypothetical protein